jgi:hypothetical protein
VFHHNGHKLFCHPDYNKVMTTKEYYMGHNHHIHQQPWLYAELFRRQYGNASGKMNQLFEIAKAFHKAPEMTPEMIIALERARDHMDSRFYGDLGGDEDFADHISGLSHLTLHKAATKRTVTFTHGANDPPSSSSDHIDHITQTA